MNVSNTKERIQTSDETTKTVSFELPMREHRLLKAYCAALGETQNQVLTRLVREYIETHSGRIFEALASDHPKK